MRPHLGAGAPGFFLHVQPGKHAVALACANVLARAQALAGLDGALRVNAFTRLDTPARLQVRCTRQGAPHQHALPCPHAVASGQVAAHAQALVARHRALGNQILPNKNPASEGELAAANHIPCGAQGTAAGDVALHLHAPIGAHIATGLQRAPTDNTARHTNILARHHIATRTQAAARADRATGLDDRGHINAAAHLDRAGKHNRLSLQRIHRQHRSGGAKLREQPAGIVHTPGVDQGVQRVLIAGAVFHMAAEPAETISARVLGPQKLFGEFHRHHPRPRAVVCSWAGAVERGKGPLA